MKIQSLFENLQYHDSEELQNEFRKIANEFQLKLPEAPRTLKGATWFGGEITPDGGNVGERKSGDERLPLELRVKGFVRELAKKLQSMMEEGKLVMVEKDSPFYGTWTVDNIFQALMGKLQHNPWSKKVQGGAYTLKWGVADDLGGLEAIYLGTEHSTDAFKNTFITYTANVSPEDRKKYMKQFRTYIKTLSRPEDRQHNTEMFNGNEYTEYHRDEESLKRNPDKAYHLPMLLDKFNKITGKSFDLEHTNKVAFTNKRITTQGNKLVEVTPEKLWQKLDILTKD